MPDSPLDRGWAKVICIASGPSLTAAQCAAATAAQADGWRIVVINNTWRLVPSADLLYSADGRWWDCYVKDVRREFRGESWTQDEPAAQRYGLHYVRSVNGNGIPAQADMIGRGRNSGHQAIGLAYRFGARRIVLIGYDMARSATQSHWHGDHPPPLGNGDPAAWQKNFAPLAEALEKAGVDVVNASAETALTAFPRAGLLEALAAA